MALRLSEAELTAALAGLGPAERVELLSLLEARAALEEEQLEDPRAPIGEMIETERQKCAALSEDPEGWLRRDAAHAESRSAHYQRLLAERGVDMAADVNAWMQASLEAWAEAETLATVECPGPDTHADEPQPDEADDRPRLPRSVALDVEHSRAHPDDNERLDMLLKKVGISREQI